MTALDILTSTGSLYLARDRPFSKVLSHMGEKGSQIFIVFILVILVKNKKRSIISRKTHVKVLETSKVTVDELQCYGKQTGQVLYSVHVTASNYLVVFLSYSNTT